MSVVANLFNFLLKFLVSSLTSLVAIKSNHWGMFITVTFACCFSCRYLDILLSDLGIGVLEILFAPLQKMR
jgi:hypothetical protein